MDSLSYALGPPPASYHSPDVLEPSLSELLGQAGQSELHMALGTHDLSAAAGMDGTHERAPAPGYIADMPNGMYSPSQVAALGGSAPSPLSGGGGPPPSHMSPPSSYPTPSSSAHMPSFTSGYMNGSASDAATSPQPTSDHTYSSSSGTPATPSEFANFPFASSVATPVATSDPHMTAVQSMLSNIAHTAQSAQRMCSEGQTSYASSQIDQLRHTIGLVSQLFRTLQIEDAIEQLTMPRNTVAPGEMSLPPSVPPSLPPSLPISPPQMQTLDSYMPLAAALPPPAPADAHLDVLDNARKRCASSVTEERAIKAIKLEPLSDANNLAAPGSSLATPVGQYSPPSQPPPMQQSDAPYSLQSVADYGLVANGTAPQAGFEADIPPVGPDFVLTRRNTWSERPPVLQHRHTLSVGSGLTMNGTTAPASAGIAPPFTSAGSFGPPPIPPLSAGPDTVIAPGVPRTARSMSLTNAYSKPVFLDGAVPAMPSAFPDNMADLYQFPPDESPFSYSPDEDSEDGPSSGGHSPPRGREDAQRPGTSSGPSRLPSRSRPDAIINEVPPEYRADVDRVFFGFLERVCSDLDATDAKGELIHQTLMAKKMQRLDESPDFRPFKFRIQAFTNAFLEELCRQGYPEEVLPMKKVRYYLWNNQYISRYNEDGKKTKSKGNHIWSIDARKLADGGWTFRPFHRRLAGAPPPAAYVGLRWSWTPRVWDPQNARANVPVHYSSPWLPTWLSWTDDVLAGTPPADAESCDIVVNASFVQDGQDETLSHRIQVHVSPLSSTEEPSSSSMRRPSLSSLTEANDPRRISSDNTVPQSVKAARRVSSGLAPKPIPNSTDAQVVQVLEQAAERVAQQTQDQVIASAAAGVPVPDMDQLVAQRNVLQFTAKVYGEVTGQTPSTVPQTTPVVALADQAKQMVFSAAVAASSRQPTTSAPPTVNEVSVEAQHAVAHALEITGPLSNEVQVLMTARSLLDSSSGAAPHSSVAPPAVPFPSGMMPVHHSLPLVSMHAGSRS